MASHATAREGKKKGRVDLTQREGMLMSGGYKRLADCVVTPRQPTRSHQGQV